MVGPKPQISLAEITGRYVGRSWREYSCIKLMHDVFADLGADVPDTYDGIALAEAVDIWRMRPAFAIARMIALFRGLGRASSTKSPCRFDLLVLRRGGEVFPGIYIGQGKFMTSSLEEGVTVAKIGRLNRPIAARSLL